MKHIPCMITIGNFICGLLAVHSLLFHDIYSAVTFIFVGMFLDFFDGMAARKLNAVSDIGKELDSFADLITFGVAPAMLAYNVALYSIPFIGTLCTLAYGTCGAIRLSRFNVHQSKSPTFIGMPIPLAGICLVILSFMNNSIVLALGTCVLSYLMVSKIKFPHFKRLTVENSEVERCN
ncbi:CDP-diacylglycerol--serine O-phosphatidyltransferase [Lysinibacillus sp. FJAT-14745]|uniref:CDP-diacylglycerol--serine O-phosphatidyltransferase n=1 Tax=Lysinibacillus sp. FJAT-14745 TaxID=1704289 RepID=UPI0006ABBB34|nr:CDP-diacylglycerol--serine O-phosphatidyltransferase [Lysinibacillus sp. FJAT-14745]KOP72702.1 CDP-diacylglycerol--serine O-phosphatidyltransferase [Lysinibacillus sp. FJAT-14745]